MVLALGKPALRPEDLGNGVFLSRMLILMKIRIGRGGRTEEDTHLVGQTVEIPVSASRDAGRVKIDPYDGQREPPAPLGFSLA